VHPAFSVIFFTTASGAGFGLLIWLGMMAMADFLPSRGVALLMLGLGAVLAAVGLLSSLLHLGKPLRAWRAFSQWRSSWLSREGVFAVASFVPVLWLGWLFLTLPLKHEPAATFSISLSPHLDPELWSLVSVPSLRIAGGLLAALATASVCCTAMIYASLKPIRAWTHPLVLPVYLAFALVSGGLIAGALVGIEGYEVSRPFVFAAGAGAVLLCLLKLGAWRYVDDNPLPVSRNAALGLPHTRAVQVFERPHTEANYLLKEMGYVLARRHARRLRLIAMFLFGVLPLLSAVAACAQWTVDSWPWFAIAACSTLLGAVVERWLFFAEAKHLVTLYY
jgi:DMSO reductase anchor subunit